MSSLSYQREHENCFHVGFLARCNALCSARYIDDYVT